MQLYIWVDGYCSLKPIINKQGLDGNGYVIHILWFGMHVGRSTCKHCEERGFNRT